MVGAGGVTERRTRISAVRKVSGKGLHVLNPRHRYHDIKGEKEKRNRNCKKK